MNEPRMPSRVRIHRPDLWRDEATGQLAPDVRDLYLGLGTLTDDAGWLLWRPATIAATLYPFEAVRRRTAAVERRGAALTAAELLVRHPCGCAFLPRMARDLAQRTGVPSFAIIDYHVSHTDGPVPSVRSDYVGLRSATSDYVLVLDSVSVSDSGSDSGSGAEQIAGSNGTAPLGEREHPDSPPGSPLVTGADASGLVRTESTGSAQDGPPPKVNGQDGPPRRSFTEEMRAAGFDPPFRPERDGAEDVP